MSIDQRLEQNKAQAATNNDGGFELPPDDIDDNYDWSNKRLILAYSIVCLFSLLLIKILLLKSIHR